MLKLSPSPWTRQGSLSALKWPHVFIADSLAMGEAAARMAATGGVDSIVCMGVDFMSESVRATLDANSYQVCVPCGDDDDDAS
jgi:quinolinate synthase